MSHVRKQLRDAVAAAVTGLATTGARVFRSRIYPLELATLPCLAVYTANEEATLTTLEDILQRDVAVIVEGNARIGEDLDDTLDQIGKEVEIALAAQVTVGGALVTLFYTGCDIDLLAGDKPVGCITLRYSGTIYTASNAPDVALNG